MSTTTIPLLSTPSLDLALFDYSHHVIYPMKLYLPTPHSISCSEPTAMVGVDPCVLLALRVRVLHLLIHLDPIGTRMLFPKRNHTNWTAVNFDPCTMTFSASTTPGPARLSSIVDCLFGLSPVDDDR